MRAISTHRQRGLILSVIFLVGTLALVFFSNRQPVGNKFEVPEDLEIPKGMVLVPGGKARIGSTTGAADEQPVFRVDVLPFLMNRHPVTVAQFRTFVDSTGYQTSAEKLGSGIVLNPRSHRWELVAGASWRSPLGPNSPSAPDDHPVTQVSWEDANAYCRWAGKRLPTEAEWEHAARNARNQKTRFSWGDSIKIRNEYQLNYWQGPFPIYNTGDDGYLYTSPVGAFGRTPLGLTDMAGNVWEWCEDWYRSYGDRDKPFEPTEDSKKVQRGGSFLCEPTVSFGFRVSARSNSTPETALFHTGFRPVMDIIHH